MFQKYKIKFKNIILELSYIKKNTMLNICCVNDVTIQTLFGFGLIFLQLNIAQDPWGN